MARCWFCHDEIQDVAHQPVHASVVTPAPPPSPFPPPPPAAKPVPSRPTEPASSRIPTRVPRRHRVSAVQVIFEGIVAALLLTLGLLAMEAFMPKFTSTTPVVSALDHASFPDLGFEIDHPAGWAVDTSKNGVSFRSPDPARGFRVGPVDLDFDDVKDASEKLDRARFRSHEVIDTGRGERAGRDAYKRILHVAGLRIDQWLIETDDGALRAEFWSRLADEDASDINSAIVDTLELR